MKGERLGVTVRSDGWRTLDITLVDMDERELQTLIARARGGEEGVRTDRPQEPRNPGKEVVSGFKRNLDLKPLSDDELADAKRRIEEKVQAYGKRKD